MLNRKDIIDTLNLEINPFQKAKGIYFFKKIIEAFVMPSTIFLKLQGASSHGEIILFQNGMLFGFIYSHIDTL